MACSAGVKAAICCALIGAIIVIISVISVMVARHQAPIEIKGAYAHIQQITEVRNSLIELDNRTNFSGIGLGCVLVLIILLMSARASHHCIVKKPSKARKREVSAQREARLIKIEGLLKAKGYMV